MGCERSVFGEMIKIMAGKPSSEDIKWFRGQKPGVGLCTRKDVTFLEYQALKEIPDVIHGFTTRLGGVSEGDQASMNLSFSQGDDPEAVRENYRRISAAIGFSPEQIVCSKQTHTANVRIVTRQDAGNGVTKEQAFMDVDGMVTNEPGLVLAAFFADCVPVFLADPVQKSIGLVHAGWKGTVGQIARNAIILMQETYGTDPANLIACIGPSICPDCYEVEKDVLDRFRTVFPQSLWHHLYTRKKEPGKYQLDLPLPPGKYEYAYYIGMKSYPDKTNPERCYTPDGKEASLLVVTR